MRHGDLISTKAASITESIFGGVENRTEGSEKSGINLIIGRSGFAPLPAMVVFI